MTLHWLDHVFFVLIALVLPLADFRGLRRRADAIQGGRDDLRCAMYRSILWQEWLMATVLLALWFALGRTGRELGTVTPLLSQAWIGYALTAIAAAGLVAQVPFVLNSPTQRAAVRKQLATVGFLLPHSAVERRLYAAVSATAGICEELIYRGFVIAYLMAVTGLPLWPIIGLSAVVFGLAHAYQGPAGAIRAGVTGGVMGLFYGLTGSLVAPMILHAMVDLVSGHIGTRVGTGEDRPRLSPANQQVAQD